MSDESFANFVFHQSQKPVPVTSTPLKTDNNSESRGIPRKWTERDSPGANTSGQPEKIRPPTMASIDDQKTKMLAEGMPTWGLLLFESINSRFDEVDNSISKLETSVNSSIETKCKEVKDDCYREIEKVQDQVDNIVEDVTGLNFHVAMMREAIWDLQDEQARNEMFQRKRNLLFAGIKEVPNESESDLEEKVRAQLGRMKVEGHPNLKDAPFDNIHRNGVYKPNQSKPRDIIVKFKNIKQKSATLRGKMSCSKGVFINMDLPKVKSSVHRQLKPILKAIKGTPYQEKGRVVLKPDCILVDNKRYTLDTIMTLPANLMFWTSNVKSSLECYAWHGNMCPFSNFFWAPIIILGILYLFAEQYIAAERARFFGDDDTLKKILMSRDPYECKTLGHRVKDFDQSKWDDRAGSVADTVIRAKVNQHDFIKQFLLNTGDKKLAEAAEDSLWGCGLKLDDPNVVKYDKWLRVGHAGRVLMSIRSELRSPPNSPPRMPRSPVTTDDAEMDS